MRGDRTKGSLRERISLMFRERTREGRPFREAKRVRFPFSSTKIKQSWSLLTGFFYFHERRSNQREFEGKDFPHVSGENTRGPALSRSEAREIPLLVHQFLSHRYG